MHNELPYDLFVDFNPTKKDDEGSVAGDDIKESKIHDDVGSNRLRRMKCEDLLPGHVKLREAPGMSYTFPGKSPWHPFPGTDSCPPGDPRG